MAVTDHARYEMHRYFIEAMGEERAATLMAHLPPVGWADLATKQDLEVLRKQDIAGLRKDVEALRELTTVRFEAIEQRMATTQDIAELRAHMDETLREQLVTIVTCMIGLVTGMAGLLGAGAAIF